MGPVADFSGGSKWLRHCEVEIVAFAPDLRDSKGERILLIFENLIDRC